MTLQLLRRACVALALLVAAVLGCSQGGDEPTGVGGVLVVSRVDIEGGNRVVLIGGTRQLQATPRTSTGIAVPGRTATWSSMTPAIAQVNSSGLVTGVASGSVSITAEVDGVTGRLEVDVRRVPVATVQAIASVTTLQAGQTTQLQSLTLDSVGGVLLGRSIAWTSSNPAVATVSPQGLVTAVGAGSVIFTVTSEGRSGSVTFTVTPRPPSGLGFVTQPSNATAGMAITPAIRVALQDETGNTVTSATGTVTLTFASNPGGATLTGALSVQAVQGVATFPDVRVNRAGQGYTLRATAPGFAEAVSATFNVSAGPPTALAVVVEPAGGSAAGAAFGQQPVVQLRDALGNDARQAGVTVTAVLASGPGTLTGTTSVVTGSDGRAVFTNLAIVGSVGSYSLQFTATGLTPATSSTFSLGAGLATQLTFTTAPPGTAVNGQPLGTTVVVQLRDGTGNPVAQAGTLVTAAIHSGTGSLGGTLVVATNSSGAAEFPGLVITGIVGNFTLRFSAPGVTPAISNTIALQPGAATQLTFTTAPPSTATNGVELAPATVVQLRDVSGNAVATAGVSISASIVTGAGGVLDGTLAMSTAANGTATFSTLRVTGLVGQYTLRFSGAGLSPATANPLTLGPGAATALAVLVHPPATTSSGQVLSPQPSVRVVDQSGNTVTSSSLTVTATLASGPGTLDGTLTAAAVNGVATFTNLAITGQAGTYTLDFSSAPLAKATSNAIEVQAASPATKLVFSTTPPATAESGVAFNPAPVVQLQDASSNPVSQAGVVVTVSRVSGNSAVVITGGSASTDASGKATFSGLTLTGPADDYVLAFLSAGLTGVTSSSIALASPPPTTIAANSATSQSATVGTAVAEAPSVLVTGAGGVPVSGVEVTFTVTAGGGTITPASPATVSTNASGIATLSNWTLGATPGTNTVTAAVAGLTGSPVTFTATGTAVVATTIAANSATSQSATVGTAVAEAPSVLVTGAGGVPVSGVEVTFAVTSGGGSTSPASPATVATNASGIATLSSWTLGLTPGSNTVTATAAGLAGSPVTFTANGTAVGATTIAANSATSQSATVGTAVAEAPSVLVTGAGGVPVSGVEVTFAVTSGGGSTSPASPATVATNASGIATLSNWTLGLTAGSNTVTATAAGLTGSPVTFSATGTAAAANALAIATQPGGAQEDEEFDTQPVIWIIDTHGNVVTSSTANVTSQIHSGSGNLKGTKTVKAMNGVATFTNLKIDGTGPHRLRFTSSGLASVVSETFTVEPD
ncbi:MAG TPA: Ig-like domain-containing protein [Gemmatimonadales bacterium]|nr:Ig-like domain-containing protein [Gemmatimonadales bacterium]